MLTKLVIMTALSPWLSKKYGTLLARFGFLPFAVDDAGGIIGKSPPAALVLSRLSKRGWAERWARAEYRLVHPLVGMMMEASVSGPEWRAKIPHRDRLPLVELAVARLVEEFGERLSSIVLFGSVARGRAKPESDIDLLVVAEGIPESYGERVRLGQRLLSSGAIEDWTMRLWEERRVYTNFDLTLLSQEEASRTHPPYLDLVEDSIRILDREDFMLRIIEGLRERLREIGAFRVTLPDGTWYWNLAGSSKEARELIL